MCIFTWGNFYAATEESKFHTIPIKSSNRFKQDDSENVFSCHFNHCEKKRVQQTSTIIFLGQPIETFENVDESL